jgi:ABC-type antimicrobial peptide transport system permease subunit
MEMRLLRGRDFADRDSNASTKVVLLNESLARRLFADGDAIGRKVTIGRNATRKDLEVVGIVQDSKYQRLQEPARNIAYLPCAQLAELFKGTKLVAVVRSRADQDVRAGIVHEVTQLDARVPVHLETVSDRIAESLVKERVLAMLAIALGAIALALACAAVFGLMAYAVSSRTNEIGLRMALGAAPAGVLRAVLAESTAVAAAGLLLALPLTLWLGRYLRTLLCEISPFDLPSIAAAALLMVTLAGVAALIPAVRASRISPVSALKAE